MSNETKKYAGLEALQTFLDGCKSIFASITHKHKLSDISDYTVDTELSSTSTNPVENKTINAEFEAVATAMNALDLAIDSKSDSDHTHEIVDVTNLEDTITTLNDIISQKSQVQIDSEMISTFNIYRLTQEQYDQELEAGTIDETALYLTPDEEIDLSRYATVEYVDSKLVGEHNHDDVYYTETEIDAKIFDLHTDISTFLEEAKSHSDSNLEIAKTYTDNAVVQKTQVQIVTWEAND